MNTTKLKLFFTSFVTLGILGFGNLSWGADIKCDVCHMTIPQNARHHIILKNDNPAKTPLHICSLSCVLKARKFDSKYSKIDIADFNHPEKFLNGETAFFLIKSSKIKSDLGEMAMPPYLAAFATKEEAKSVHTKYGDGEVTQGFESVLKK